MITQDLIVKSSFRAHLRAVYLFLNLCTFLFASAVAQAAPASPARVEAIQISTYAYVSWTAVSGATSYRIQKLYSRDQPLTTSGTEIADIAVMFGSTYTYQVSACDASGCSAPANAAPLTIGVGAPNMPMGVTAAASASQIAIAWNAVSGATSYTLRKTVGGAVSEISGIAGTSYTDTAVAPGTTYTYNVKACNGGGCSAISAGATASTPVPPVPIPAAPASVQATSLSGYAIISWTAVSGATSYQIQRVYGQNGPMTSTGTEIADLTVQIGNTYTFQVSACNGSGCSAATTSNAVTIAAPPPAMPTGLTATASGAVIVVGWNAVSGATSYTIQRTVSGVVTNISGIAGTGYVDPNVTPGARYTYNVKACNSGGCSAISSGASATAAAAIPGAPAIVQATSLSGYAIISWTAVSGATSYRIQRVYGQNGQTSTGTEIADLTVQVGNTYTYQVSACNGSGCSAATTSNAVTISPPVPAVPTGVRATASGASIVVDWVAVSGATSYTIQRTAGGAVTTVTGRTGTSYVDPAVTPGTTYIYQVRACNSAGCSASSSGASATVTLALPGAPAFITVTQSGLTVKVAWAASANATLYRMRRAGGASAVAFPDTAGTGVDDTNVPVDTELMYQVQACNSTGCSAGWTSSATIRIPHIPAAPAPATATARADAIYVSWPSTDNASSFKLNRNGSQIAAAATAPYADAGVTKGTSYVYGVSGCNSTGCSAYALSAPVIAGEIQAGVKVSEEFDYDVLGRLRRVGTDGSTRARYDYDKAGNRRQVTE